MARVRERESQQPPAAHHPSEASLIIQLGFIDEPVDEPAIEFK
jgi:hypothetical protein